MLSDKKILSRTKGPFENLLMISVLQLLKLNSKERNRFGRFKINVKASKKVFSKNFMKSNSSFFNYLAPN